MNPQATNTAVRVFISYAWEDEDYRQWVAQLASQLREDGIDARLDRWHLQRGQTIPDFMSSEVRKADKVLVLCSPKYRERVHAMEEGGPSTGLGWESMLLSSAMFVQDARSKAIPALARGAWIESAPDYLQGLPYEDLTQADETHLHRAYTALLRSLTDTTETAPPLGSASDIPTPKSVSPLFAGRSLEAVANDRSTLPPIVTLPMPHRMPYRSLGDRFAGRIEALWALHDLLSQEGTAVVEGVGVVVGTGGLGKTQLATEYVHRFGNYYPGGLFWTDADRGLPVVVQQIAESAGIDIDGAIPIHKQCEALWQTLGQTPTPVLIVLDNFSETQALEPWLPVGANLKALVTTRRRDLAYPKVSLPFLTHEEGLELLNTGERAFGAEATLLIDTLGGLPLALELSRNFLNRNPTLDIDALLAEIAKLGELAALNLFAEHYRNELPTGHEKAVGGTFQLSWELASEAEQKLLRLMAFWAPSPVPRRLLKRAVGDTSDSVLTNPVDIGIEALERLSLVELDEDFDPQIHRLLRGFVRAQTHEADEQTRTQAVEAVRTELARIREETDTAALTELEKVLPHGQALLDTAVAEPEQAIDIANYIGWHQRQRGRYQLAKEARQHALTLAKKTYAPGHPTIATSQSNLALVLRDLGDLEGAKGLLSEALEADQQNFEPGHPEIAKDQSNLATVLRALGDLEGAKGLLSEALESDKQSYALGHPEIAIKQSNLALVLRALGDLEGAKGLLSEALESDKQSYAPGHPEIAIKQSNLAMVLRDLGDLENAKRLLIDSYEALKNLLGDDHPKTLMVKGNLEMVESEIQKH